MPQQHEYEASAAVPLLLHLFSAAVPAVAATAVELVFSCKAYLQA
jgi:hypothetical protein